MRSSPFILALAASFSMALAFSGMNPVIAGWPNRNDAVPGPSAVGRAAVLMNSAIPHWEDVSGLMFGDGLCEFDAAPVVQNG
ncbi:hypothetical protein H4582DRAFT_2087340 [Lactarius indigo]|nr:hypothetical protein H4582DRAFT_2087340 [Lactarius indigo]